MGMELPIAHAGVVEAGVPRHMGHGVFRLDMCAALSYYYGQLGLEIKLLGDDRSDQRCIVGQQRLGEALENHRVLTDFAASLFSMCDVVNAHADDLPRRGNNRIQLHVIEGVVGCCPSGIGLGLLQ
ncbi:hypothetical protein D3C86_1315160 [compost metagenome]